MIKERVIALLGWFHSSGSLLLCVVIVLLLFLTRFDNFHIILHSNFLLECIKHVIYVGVHNIVSLHELCSHFIIDEYFVHFVIKHLHIFCHFCRIDLAHLLAHQPCHRSECVYHFLIIVHRFHLIAHQLHFDSGPLIIEGYAFNQKYLRFFFGMRM